MIYLEQYWRQLIIDIMEESQVKLIWEEKYSAAGLGLAYARCTYTPKRGLEYFYIRNCILQALEFAGKKQNVHKKIESDLSMDKKWKTENGTCTYGEFLAAKCKSVEDYVIFNLFLESLENSERYVARMLLRGYSLSEIAEKKQYETEELEKITQSIVQQWKSYYDEAS